MKPTLGKILYLVMNHHIYLFIYHHISSLVQNDSIKKLILEDFSHYLIYQWYNEYTKYAGDQSQINNTLKLRFWYLCKRSLHS